MHNTVIWNNKYICIQGNFFFCEALLKKGIIALEDLTTEEMGLSQVFKLWEVHHLHLKKSFI